MTDMEIPEGWTICRLPVMAELIMGQSPPGNTYNDHGDGLPFFQGKADFGERNPTVRKWCSAPKKVAVAGDVLMSIRAPVGPTNVADQRCAIGRGLAVIRANGASFTGYLLHALRLQQEELAEQGVGSTFTAINRSHLESVAIPLPPLAEQRRIVAKVEELLERVTIARERMTSVPAILKRFRKSVLAAACSGRLTVDWREQNEGAAPIAQLMDAVNAERFRLWCRSAVAKAKAANRILRADRFESQYGPAGETNWRRISRNMGNASRFTFTRAKFSTGETGSGRAAN